MRNTSVFPFCLLLAGCVAAAPDTAAELAIMRAAPKPSSEQAAERAVQAYFQTKLMDPTEPLYHFPLPPKLCAVGMLKTRQVGWMICGEINSKNRTGGYAGFERFFAYFSPRVPDTVVDALIGEDDISRGLVSDWCRDAYKTSTSMAASVPAAAQPQPGQQASDARREAIQRCVQQAVQGEGSSTAQQRSLVYVNCMTAAGLQP